MNDIVKNLVVKTLRKVVFTVGGVWITKMVADGSITDGQVETVIQVLAAVLIMVGAAGWSTAIDWLKARNAKKAE